MLYDDSGNSDLQEFTEQDFIKFKLLGEGAFGKVYASMYTPFKNVVALKEIDIMKVEKFNE